MCPLPKRNYGFEKRQKDLAKQRKREEKAQKKLERKAAADVGEAEEAAEDGEDQPREA